MTADAHRVQRLWLRAERGGAMQPRSSLTLESGKGVVGDHTFGRLRHVTIVFKDDWDEAARVVGHPVDPAGRRANVLLSGGGGRNFVGKRVRVGRAVVEVKGITEPCPVMDRAGPGMHEALKPNGRAGIWGRVLEGGEVCLNDAFASLDE